MRDATRELERVRRIGRALLVGQRLLQWLAVVEVALLAAALVDFALRFPGWLRLIAILGAGAVGIFWLVTRLARALALRPELDALALRAEQLHPELAGLLASGVEFSLRPDRYAGSPRTAALATATVRSLEGKLRQGASMGGLLNLYPTLRRLGACAAAAVVLIAMGAMFPQDAMIAAHRWFAPLGATQWPRRTAIASLMPAGEVWPSDAPLRLRARVDKGYRAGMRTWVVYRFITPATPDPAWQSALMNEQAALAAPVAPASADSAKSDAGAPGANPKSEVPASPGTFERLLDLPESVRNGTAAATPGTSTVEFHFDAGDDATSIQTISLVDRPSLRGIHLAIQPPGYARGLVAPQDVDLDQQTSQVATAAALVGSRVRWTLDLNKPIPAAWPGSPQFMPGLKGVPGLSVECTGLIGGPAGNPRVVLSFPLVNTVQSVIRLQDQFGLSNLSDRLYRIEATPDQPPAVSMVLPVSDESVLASAVVPLEAVAQDDVAVESVELQAQRPVRDRGMAPTAAPAAVAPTPAPPQVLAQTTGRQARLTVDSRLDLSPMGLQPGDEVDVTAVAQDVFELDGQRHAAVRSAPRRLRVIDAATLAAQIWSDLGGVRQQAVRLEGDQRDLFDQAAAQALPGQQEISQRVDTQAGFVRALQDRVARNHLQDPTLNQVLQRASDLLQQGTSASQAAAAKLEESRRNPAQPAGPRAQARDKQVEVGNAMASLVDALDQGQGTAATELKTRQLISQLQNLNQGVRSALPRTAGKDPGQLSPDEKKEVGDLSQRQSALAGAAEALVNSMASEGDKLSKDSDPQKQAAGAALQAAAAIAKRQGLDPEMKSAAKSTQDNKLSDASSAQEHSLQTLQSMLGEFAKQDQQRQEELQRQLAALAEAVQKLIDQQKAQIQTLDSATDVRPLDGPQSLLRQNTLGLSDQARGARGTAAAAKPLDEAGEHQAQAITALRDAKKPRAAAGERSALASLQAALDELHKQARQAQRDQARQTREKLRGEYVKLAKEQDDLRVKTQALTDGPDLPRSQRVKLIELGTQEAGLRQAIAGLRDQVAETLLFTHLHDRIDHVAADVAARLSAARADRDLPSGQARVSIMLRTMAAALAEAQRQELYSTPQEEGPSGAGGQGGGGQQPLVPPAAELKLLRGMQADVLQQTRDAAQQPGDADARDRTLADLADQQRDLSSLGDRLIQKLSTHPHGGTTPPGTE